MTYDNIIEKELGMELNKIIFDEKLTSSHFSNPFNIVFSAAGCKGFYYAGVAHSILKCGLYDKVNSMRGSSSGAISAAFLACKVDIFKWLKMYLLSDPKLCLIDNFSKAAELLPDNAHKLCEKKNVEIVTTEIGFFYLKQKIFNTFETREDLINCLKASSCIPFLTYNKFPYCINIKGKYYIDGGFTNILPFYRDCLQNQLVISLSRLEYSLWYVLCPRDKNIHKLFLHGAKNFHSFINNHCRKTEIFSLVKKEDKINNICLNQINEAIGFIYFFIRIPSNYLCKKFNIL